MKIINTNLDGLIVFQPQTYEDVRGSFCEVWREENYKAAGIKETFVQDNISVSQKNVLRGLHYQKDQGQLVTVLQGKIFDVVVDVRESSKTYQNYFSIKLDGISKKQLYMPPGFAHGFYVLSDVAVILYKCTQYYNQKKEQTFAWDSHAFSVNWPTDNPLMSEKDQSAEKIFTAHQVLKC